MVLSPTRITDESQSILDLGISRFVYSYKKADFDALKDTLDATPFLCALDNENVDDDWQCWHDLFIACVIETRA